VREKNTFTLRFFKKIKVRVLEKIEGEEER
jgi:hypothetical protein